MATAFKQLANNAVSTTSTSYASTGVTSTTVATGTGTKFPTPGNGFRLTIWTGAVGSDPAADANMEVVTVTARSTDVLTHSATTKTHSSPVNVAILVHKDDVVDLQTAVNTLESAGGGGGKPVIMSNSSLRPFSDLNKYTTGTGAAVTAYNLNQGGFYTETGTTSSGNYDLLGISNKMYYMHPFYDKNPMFYFLGNPRATPASSTAYHYIGFDRPALSGSAGTEKSFGFIIKNNNGTGEIYSYHRDGTNAEVTTLLTGAFAITDQNTSVFVAKMTSGTDIKFYINGTLYATHATNLPTGVAAGRNEWGVSGWNTAGTASNSIAVFELGLSYEAY